MSLARTCSYFWLLAGLQLNKHLLTQFSDGIHTQSICNIVVYMSELDSRTIWLQAKTHRGITS